MSPDLHRHNRRRRLGRLWLIVIFFMLAAANALLWYYTSHRINPWPWLRGHVFGATLTTTLLLIGIWRHRPWARYVLMFFLWYILAVFSSSLLVLINERVLLQRRPIAALLAALSFYTIASVMLARSRKIQHLARTASSGD